MDYFELANEFAKEMDKYKYQVEFDFNMPLRDFITWLLNLPISIYIFAILFFVCINILVWYIKHPPQD